MCNLLANTSASGVGYLTKRENDSIKKIYNINVYETT
jgi:hypothetical protein